MDSVSTISEGLLNLVVSMKLWSTIVTGEPRDELMLLGCGQDSQRWYDA